MYAQLEAGASSRIELTPIVVFLAFSIESYLNSIGARKLIIWDELERLPWKNKVVILHKTAGRSPPKKAGRIELNDATDKSHRMQSTESG